MPVIDRTPIVDHRLRVLLILLALCAADPASAAENAATQTFMGQEITGARTDYLVVRDVNVRAEPETGAERVDGLRAGQHVVSPGQYKSWIAVEKPEGVPLGFVYFKFLQPYVDGTLKAPISGKIKIGPRTCSYRIEFRDKSQPEGEIFEFADYDVAVRCTGGGRALEFSLYEFMTEGPYAPDKDTVHQIGVDLPAVGSDMEHVLSTIIFYDHAEHRVSFDQVTIPEFAQKPKTPVALASSVAEAVEAAVRMALTAWNGKVWKALENAPG